MIIRLQKSACSIIFISQVLPNKNFNKRLLGHEIHALFSGAQTKPENF